MFASLKKGLRALAAVTIMFVVVYSVEVLTRMAGGQPYGWEDMPRLWIVGIVAGCFGWEKRGRRQR